MLLYTSTCLNWTPSYDLYMTRLVAKGPCNLNAKLFMELEVLKTWPHTLARPNELLPRDIPTNHYNVLTILSFFFCLP